MKITLGSLIKQLKQIPPPTEPGEKKEVLIESYIPKYNNGPLRCDAYARRLILTAILEDCFLYWEVEL